MYKRRCILGIGNRTFRRRANNSVDDTLPSSTTESTLTLTTSDQLPTHTPTVTVTSINTSDSAHAFVHEALPTESFE